MSEPTIIEACKNGDVGALRRELAGGVSPDTRSMGPECTPLQTICWRGGLRLRGVDPQVDAEMVSILLEAGADVNARHGAEGCTALHLAVNYSKLNIIPLLIDAGASLTAETNPIRFNGFRGDVPIECISSGGRLILSFLLRAGSPLPRVGHGWLERESTLTGPYRSRAAPMCKYLAKVRAAGGWPAYERAHRTRLTHTFAPVFPALPVEVVSKVVSFYAHTGDY